MFRRLLDLPKRPKHSFFLWGPRQTGKSWLLRQIYGDANWVDLLKTDDFVRYAHRPALLREELEKLPRGTLTIIDEVQKVPMLLDEVHWLIENHGQRFGLCGSSARRVRAGHANLLGGRALRFELLGLVAPEIGHDFDLMRILTAGYLPRHYESDDAAPLLRSYVADYLKEEVAAEGLTRRLPAFTDFLSAAALGDGSLVAYATIARDCGVSAPTVREYYGILVDTLLGRFLPAYTKRPKRRVIQSPKFYFADVGVVNQLARRGTIQPASPSIGAAFENWVHHELCAYRAYREPDLDLSYWRLASGIEVDFILGEMRVAIEAKASERVNDHHMAGLRTVRQEHPKIRRRVLVSMERRSRRTSDGIDILTATDFVAALWAGEWGG